MGIKSLAKGSFFCPRNDTATSLFEGEKNTNDSNGMRFTHESANGNLQCTTIKLKHSESSSPSQWVKWLWNRCHLDVLVGKAPNVEPTDLS